MPQQGLRPGLVRLIARRRSKFWPIRDSRPDQLVQPGHVFPLRARPGGVLERAGHTEAAVDLAMLAGLPPSGVLCELVNDDGTVQRLPELLEFKETFGLRMISIAQLIEYRAKRDHLVEQICTRPFPSDYGEFTAHVFRSLLDGRHHIALAMGRLDAQPTLVRVHSENLLSDVFRGKGMSSHRDLRRPRLKRSRGPGAVSCSTWSPQIRGEALVRRLTVAPPVSPCAR